MVTVEKRRRVKKTAMLRAAGIYSDVPNGAARRHLKTLHDHHGMTIEEMAHAAGMSNGMIHAHMRGTREKINRNNMARILAIRPTPSVNKGGFIDSLPTRRRLGALTASGFPMIWLVPRTGISHNSLARIQRGQALVFAETARSIAEVYELYADKDPLDFGITQNAAGVASHYARKRGHVPSHCWDSDTIGDPNAIPEWTGACGTERGYRIHQDNKIPMCAPCRAARSGAKERRRDVHRTV